MISRLLNCGNIDATISTWRGLTRSPAPLDAAPPRCAEDEDGVLFDESIQRTARKPTNRRRASWGMLRVVELELESPEVDIALGIDYEWLRS
jgi:hypothetical protein